VATIEAIEEGNLLENAVQMGQYAREKLEGLKMKHSCIDHVRGIGLMIGIQLTKNGADIANKCLEKGLRINCTAGTVIRFMPSMTVTAEQLDEAISILDNVLTECES
jgi:acetylornithine/N-succinyldiaminopimelate aminotransferase